MKHFISLFLIVLFAIPADIMAQSWNFGIEAGYVNNTLDVSEYKATARSSFKFGLDAEYQLANKICLESGLAYIRKGATTSGIRLSGTEINSIKFAEMDYLQLPVMIGYKFNIGNHFSIKPSVGGYYAVGVGGYALIDGVDAFNQPYTERTSTFSGTNGTAYRPCNRNDGGLAFALNIGYRNFSIKAEYDLGLATATHYGNGKQRTFSVSLAYWIFK